MRRDWKQELAEAKAATVALPSGVYQEAIKRRRGSDVSVGSGKEAGNVCGLIVTSFPITGRSGRNGRSSLPEGRLRRIQDEIAIVVTK